MTRAEYLLSFLEDDKKQGKKWKNPEAEYRSASRPAGSRREGRKDRPDFTAWKDPRTDVTGAGRKRTGWAGAQKGLEPGKPGQEKVGYFTGGGGELVKTNTPEEQRLLDLQGPGRKRKMSDKEMRKFKREQRKSGPSAKERRQTAQAKLKLRKP